MPEGPEVKRIATQLNAELSGKTLDSYFILSGRYSKKIPEGHTEFTNECPHVITSVKCKGKFIYFSTDTDWSIWNTLGMSGSWSKKDDDHARIMFNFGTKHIFFTDIRNFGTVKFSKGKIALQKHIDSLGPDMLSSDLSDQDFKDILKKNGSKTLPEFVMNQHIISGVGNYVKAEALYLSKLSPHRLCNTLSTLEAEALNKAIKSVLRSSYENGGSTFKSYSDFNGDAGEFTDRFAVYRKKQDPLGHSVISTETKDKRTTWWAPAIQK